MKIQPIQSGGGQERGIRSGTVPTPLVVGFGEACEIANHEMKVENIFFYFRFVRHCVRNECIHFPMGFSSFLFFSFQYDHEWMELLSKRLLDKLMSKIPQVVRNGDAEHSYPGCINLSFAYVEGTRLR